MDHGRSDIDKMDDIMLPGFRFHPTDEELVGFYLKKKIQQQPLPIELIKQVDIYKYDPWDLPKLASTGEKEWYFYCPRDRKYRNSPRPNRVTGAGFWKATGTDRPIYSSDSNKCIGLKKSLVFYRGKAAKGLKTDWMMHEFRLPSIIHDSASPKKIWDRNLPAHDAWAICRIFKKNNSMAQRAISHSWVSPIPETTASSYILDLDPSSTHLSSEALFSCTTEIGSAIQLCNNYDSQQASTASFSPLDVPSYKPMNPTVSKSFPFPTGFLFSSFETSEPITKNTLDLSSMFYAPPPALVGWDVTKNSRSTGFEVPQQFSVFSNTSQYMQGSVGSGEDHTGLRKHPSEGRDSNGWENMPSIGYPFSLPSDLPDAWKPNLPWDSPSCPSELSTTYHE